MKRRKLATLSLKQKKSNNIYEVYTGKYIGHRSAHDAISDLKSQLETKKFRYVVEADIKGYFDNLDHDG